MPQTRQSAFLVRTFGVTFFTPQKFSYPVPDWDQLIYAVRGVITVHTQTGAWVLPAQRALWAPAGIEHWIDVPGPVSLRSLYIPARKVRTLGRDCCTVNVSPLLRELILYTVKQSVLDSTVPRDRRVLGVLLDQLRTAHTVPLQLPLPSDERARRVAELLQRSPAGDALPKISRRAGASLRTLERIFRAETGMGFGEWRRRMRLLHALRRLASGEPVTTAALESGYESTSAFIAMFKRKLGTTPGRYFNQE
jgi:AraC-like DNA-binding protein